MDTMKRIYLILFSAIPGISLAAQPTNSVINQLDNSKAHVISGASQGGGEDPRSEALSIQVTDANGPATDAKCTLSNDKGNWSTTGAEPVTILRSASDLTIVCSKDGYAARTLIVSAGTTQVERKHFRFAADSDESDDTMTVPYYNATISVNFTAAVAAQPSN
jgi:hypothetical protein